MKHTILTLTAFLFTTFMNAQQPFITTWGAAANDLEIAIPANPAAGTYNYNVNFGDGTIVNNATTFVAHTYANPGIYTVTISGTFPKVDWTADPVVNGFNRRQLFTVEQWGDIQWTSMNKAFAFCLNLTIPATDTPDLSMVTDMNGMFINDTAFNNPINHWDVSTITDMRFMFDGAAIFNQPLNNWNVTNVTGMQGMFMNAASFNRPLNNWNVANVTNMKEMFKGATAFNVDISSWNVASVTDMEGMFMLASAFNKPVNNWNVANVTKMASLFTGATAFNQPLNNWDVSGVAMIVNMFTDATSFNQPLNNWDMSNVTHAQGMFNNASAFNQPLNNWNMANTIVMAGMFDNATSFNQDISGWTYSANVGLLAFVKNSGLNVANYDALLEKFDITGLDNVQEFEADNLKYCNDSARAHLIARGWQITGDAKDANCTTTPPPTGIEDIVSKSVRIYPNPVDEYIIIEAPTDSYITKITVTNIQGQQILKFEKPTEILSAGELSPGIYILNISTKDGIQKRKFIKK